MAYVDKDLAAYLLTLVAGDKVTVSSGSSTYTQEIDRVTKTQLVMKGWNGPETGRRFWIKNGLEVGGGTASWRTDCIITPESAQSRLAARQREARVNRLRSVINGLGLDRAATKEQVTEALAKAQALVDELM
jgi:hypothetical protein